MIPIHILFLVNGWCNEKNINPRFIYIMYGLRYLSIVTTKFVKITLGLTWITSILWAASSYFTFDEKVIQKKNIEKDQIYSFI